MKKTGFIWMVCLLFGLAGCDFRLPGIANDPPRSKFSYGFGGRLEKLEDALFAAGLVYEELDYTHNLQRVPGYTISVTRSDTVLNYVFNLQDCQSLYYLVKWNDNWNCDSSYVHVERYSSNVDSVSDSVAKQIFYWEVIRPLKQVFDTIEKVYRWEIKRTEDTTYVDVFDQYRTLRKRYVYAEDTVGNGIAEIETLSYLGKAVVCYRKREEQRYVYIESRLVFLYD